MSGFCKLGHILCDYVEKDFTLKEVNYHITGCISMTVLWLTETPFYYHTTKLIITI